MANPYVLSFMTSRVSIQHLTQENVHWTSENGWQLLRLQQVLRFDHTVNC